MPKLKTYDAINVDMSKGKATLSGMITNINEADCTEKGFVYNSVGNPTINDVKIVVEEDVNGLFNTDVFDLPVSENCYIRTYAINDYGVTYGNQVTISPDIIILQNAGIAVQSRDVGIGTYYAIEASCEASDLGNYNDWRLPEMHELRILYIQKDEIGGFITDPENGKRTYWAYSKYTRFVIDFSNGREGEVSSDLSTCSGRAVRTLSLPPEL